LSIDCTSCLVHAQWSVPLRHSRLRIGLCRRDPVHESEAPGLVAEQHQQLLGCELAGADLQPRAALDFYAHLADRAVNRGEITARDRERVTTSIVTLLWGMTTLTAFDPDRLDAIVDSAKWWTKARF
ncbi:MAG: hypothetical protein QOC92_4799, partial [Acidimicrobiaceae bacterium]